MIEDITISLVSEKLFKFFPYTLSFSAVIKLHLINFQNETYLNSHPNRNLNDEDSSLYICKTKKGDINGT